MPVPTSIADLDVDEGLNYPSGSDTVGGTLDNYLRSHAAIIKRQFSKGDNLDSMSDLVVPPDSSFLNVVKVVDTISTFSDNFDGRSVWLRFEAGITLAHSSSLVLPGGTDWVTEEGDVGLFMMYEAGVWQCLFKGPLGNASLANVGAAPDEIPQNQFFTGIVVPFAGSTPPTGWLMCNGQAVSRTTYANLFSVIGTTWGPGDGSTTFNLPDTRNEFIRGSSSTRPLASSASDSTRSHSHTASTNATGSHSHNASTGSSGQHTHEVNTGQPSGSSTTYVMRGAGANPAALGSVFGAGAHTHPVSINSAGSHSHSVTVNSSGGAETAPRHIVMNHVIKT